MSKEVSKLDMPDVHESRIAIQSERLYEVYREKIDEAVPVFNSKHIRKFNKFDAYALGKCLENFETWRRMMPESIVMDNMGRVLPVALDLISAAYSTSIMSVIASTQPIDELVGVIFYKKMVAAQARQGVGQGDVLLSEFGQRDWAHRADYASNQISAELKGTLGAHVAPIAPTVADAAYKPILMRTLELKVLDASANDAVLLTAIDDGKGNIYGPNLIGTVNYNTGEIAITITDATGLADADKIVIEYQTDIEIAANIPKVSWQTVDDTIRARTFMLEGNWGMVTEFALQKRFGRAMDEEVATDLVSEINAEVATAAIKAVVASCPTSVDWNDTPPAGTSAYEHKLSFIDAIEAASTKIADTAGRGTVNYMLAAGSGLVHIATQPGFKKVATGNAMGPQVYGILNDTITVIKVPGTDIVPADKIYAGYRGTNWFEAAVVYSPYLPLFITDTVAIDSALRRARGVAHAAGIKVVAPVFTTAINIT
jgi:hypothetical protein